MADLMFPDIAGSAQQGFQQGQQQQANRLIGQAFANPGQQSQLLGQAAAVDPQAAMGAQQYFQMQQDRQTQMQAQQQAAQQAQQAALMKKTGGAARYMLSALQTKDPSQIQGAYQAIKPWLAELGQAQGKTPPDQWDDSMAPMVYQLAASTAQAFPDDNKLQVVGAGSTLPRGTTPVYSQPDKPIINSGMQLIRGPDGQYHATQIPLDDGTASQAAPDGAGGIPNVGANLVKPYDQTRVQSIIRQVNAPSPYDAQILQAAQQNGLDPKMLKAQLIAESGLNPNADNGQSIGIAQFTPGTAQQYGIDPRDPAQAINAAAKLIASNGGQTQQGFETYYGGQDQKQWGPNTQQYAANLSAVQQRLGDAGATAPDQSLQYATAGIGQNSGLGQQSGQPHTLAEAIMQQKAAEKAAGATADAGTLTDDAQQMLAAAGVQGYKIPIPALGMRNSAARVQYLNDTAAKIKAAGMDMGTGVHNMIYGETGLGGAKQIQKTFAATSMNESAAAAQAGIVTDVAKSVDRTGIPIFNKWIQAGRRATGDPQITKLDNALNTFAEEFAKVMTGQSSGAATDSARALAHTYLNSAMSPEQLQGSIELMRREMSQRTQAQGSAINQQISGLANSGGFTTPQAAQPIADPHLDALLQKYGGQ